MMPPVHVADDIQLRLVPRKGAMASLFAAFDAHGVAIHGVCAVAEGAMDVDHLLVDDADGAVAAAATVGATEVRRRPMLVAELSQLEMSGAEVLERVSAANVGIDLLYLAANGALVIGPVGDEALDVVRVALEALVRGKS